MAQVFLAKVMHARLIPKHNSFNYNVFYLNLPLSKLSSCARGLLLGINSWGLFSFKDRDHGKKDGSAVAKWVAEIKKHYQLDQADGEVRVVTMPRMLGYVFNPVSFWLCLDNAKKLRAVICEVNNTFGQTHSYICVHEDGRVINKGDVISAKKLFHVSPFLEREGHYQFSFDYEDSERLAVTIDFYNKDGDKQLITALNGRFVPMTSRRLVKCFFTYPLLTLKVVYLIHWQALKIVAKGISYIPLPKQLKVRRSASSDSNITYN